MRHSVTFLAMLWALTTFNGPSSNIIHVHGKEIEGTKEWQLVGENDTLPAGLHIRMDLSTGQKWAKLPDNNDDENSDGEKTVRVDGSSSMTVTAIAAVPQLKKDEDNIVDKNDVDIDDGNPEYDFDMMHRTLSQLPPEEQARVGGLPELPAGKSVASLTQRERELFEMRMRQIWEQRQAELRRIQEEQMADLPAILKQRIQSIRDYLNDPQTYLLAMLDESSLSATEKEGNVDDDGQELSTIVSVLADLEFLLTDLDMARDFYTLGGWPLLASLISNEVHHLGNTTTHELLSQVYKVQAHAAWVMGTAVKNTGEFTPWTVEGLFIGSIETTPLDLLQQAFASTLTTPTTSISTEAQQLQQKLVYALGSFLRANLHAQVQFATHQGPLLLAKSFVGAFGPEMCVSPHCTKMRQRLLLLVSDVLLDIQQLHQEQKGTLVADEAHALRNQALQLVGTVFGSGEWCKAVLTVLKDAASGNVHFPLAFQRATLHAVPPFSAFCPSWDKSAIYKLIYQWQELTQTQSGGGKASIQDDLVLAKQALV